LTTKNQCNKGVFSVLSNKNHIATRVTLKNLIGSVLNILTINQLLNLIFE